MEPSNARRFVRRQTRAAIGVMLMGGGIFMGSALLTAAGCVLIPLRSVLRWRPSRTLGTDDARPSLPGEARVVG